MRPGELATIAAVDLQVPGGVVIRSVGPWGLHGEEHVDVVASGVLRSGPDARGVRQGGLPAPARALELAMPYRVPDGGETLVAYVVLRGTSSGSWRADYIRVGYESAGAVGNEDLRYSLGLCVTEDVSEQCKVGIPSWWGGAH